MTWIKLDDRAPRHDKLRGLSDASFGVWVKGILHCSLHETDGRIDRADLAAIGRASARKPLYERGLWTAQEDGSALVAGYLQHQTSRDAIATSKAKARTRADKSRSVQRTSIARAAPDTDTDTEADTEQLPQSVELSQAEPLAAIERALFESIHRELADGGMTMLDALTRDEAGTLRRVARDLDQLDVTADEVHRRVAIAHTEFTQGRVTANAIGRNWSQLSTAHTPMQEPKPLDGCSEHPGATQNGVCNVCKVLARAESEAL